MGFLKDAGGMGHQQEELEVPGGLGGWKDGRWEPERPSTLGVGVQ